MNRILFLPKYSPEGASSRYRTYQFTEHFEENGFACTVKPFFGRIHLQRINESRRGLYFGIAGAILKRMLLLLTVRRYNLVFIEKEAIPYFPAIFERVLKLLSVRYILDYDDAVFHNYDRSSKKMIRLLLGKKIPRIMRSASHIICGSGYLANYALQHNEKVSRIPTVLPGDKYPRMSKRDDDFVIGWVGSYYTSLSLLMVLPVLRKFTAKYPCRIRLIGVNDIVFSEFRDMNAEQVPWSQEAEAKHLPTFDVGIAPLEDTPFNRGKCAFKIVQYMAAGSAVICSPIGANAEAVPDGVTGFHARTPEEWERGLERLYSNREERESMKQKSRERFRDHYSLEGVLPAYLNIFRSLSGNAP